MHDITAILTKTFSRSLPGRVSCSVEPQPDAAVISVESHSDVGDRLLRFTGYINYGSRIVFCLLQPTVSRQIYSTTGCCCPYHAEHL